MSDPESGPPGTVSQEVLGFRHAPGLGGPISPCRVVIEAVRPQVDGGRYAAKASLGEAVRVEADIFAEGHDELAGLLLHRPDGDPQWAETPLRLLDNDRWGAEFAVSRLGLHHFTLVAWVDSFRTWRRDLVRRVDAGQEVTPDLLMGAVLVESAAARAGDADAAALSRLARLLRSRRGLEHALDPTLERLMSAHPDRSREASLGRHLSVFVDPERARFSTWYELFPRSAAAVPGRHGTFADVEAQVPEIAAMGFDVLYMPPIHPIGTSYRKGRNNSVDARPSDPGSPWAIGSAEGGHKTVNPRLGTEADFTRLVEVARAAGLEVAVDIAFQCSPDHPYVRDHPGWFRHRPDGSIQYAENPPKNYQDIYPLDFECDDWQALWAELLSVFMHWAERGVRIFRVDNPHTKPFAFWEWALAAVKRRYPDAIFLSEAFTRPKVMYRLAKAGFTQSYTYFAWRTGSAELTEYFTELTATAVADFFRPNLWPNTPDILTEQLQNGGRPAFVSRLVLAATLGASYGVYGPPYELMEHRPVAIGREEYLNSEKYEIRHWELGAGIGLRDLITRVNRIRHAHAALQSDRSLTFRRTDNEQLLAYTKADPSGELILTVVNLDPIRTQAGWVELPLLEVGATPDVTFRVEDLLSDTSFMWRGEWNYVELSPLALPAHILRIHRPAGPE